MNPNNFLKAAQIVIRLVERIKGWEGWKKHDWPFFVLISGMVFIFVFMLKKQHFRVPDAGSIVLGLLGLWVLVRTTFPWLVWIWNSGIGKVAIAFFSVVVIAVARVMADYEIVSTTAAPASLFPRAQDILTLLFSVRVWFFLGQVILAFFIVVSQVAFIFFTIGQDLWVRSAKERSGLAFKILTSGVVVTFMIFVVEEKMLKMEFSIFEHAIVFSSFVENKTIPFHLTPGFGPRSTDYPTTFQLCPLQPRNAWVAFLKDDEVMVALPSTGTRNAFTFEWGKCGAVNRQFMRKGRETR